MPRSPSSLPRRPRASGKKEETHDRILGVASRALRRRGLGGVGVADVMKEAGLTHGGFYAHFDSREALLAESLDRMRRDMAQVLERRYADRGQGESRFRALVETYLADDNLPAFETGCPVAALGSELARCGYPTPKRRSALQSAAAALAHHLVVGVQKALPDSAPAEAAPVIASTLMGALQMARMLGDGPEARAVLAATRNALLSQYDPPSPSTPN